MKSNVSCGQAAIALLESHGVDTVFGIPGVHTLEFYRGLAHSKIAHVGVRHEQGAGFMADGYARASGRPGVCVLITGPGVCNAATAIGQAFSDSVPMIVLSSVNATGDLGKGRGRLHEITSQQAAMAPLTAFSRTIREAAQLNDAMRDAFRVFDAGRPRPVHIEVPLDVMMQPGPATTAPAKKASPPAPEPTSIAAAAALLQAAKRPLIINGGGSTACGRELAALVERSGAVVLPTVAGKGVLPDGHGRSLGATLGLKATRDFLGRADLVIAVGTELAETDHWTERLPINGKLVRIDIDGQCLTRDYKPDVAIHGDAQAALAALLAALPADKRAGVGADELARVRQANAAALSPLERRHGRVLDALRRALPDDGILVTDMTQIAYTACFHFPCPRPRSHFHPLGFGTLGYALPAAIGAKLAAPERPVVAVAGDTGLLFTVQELATAVELGLPLPILLWNNDALGQIAGDMVRQGIPETGVRLRNPDFLALAQAFGCRAVRPASLGAFEAAIAESLVAKGPTLIEVRENAEFLA